MPFATAEKTDTNKVRCGYCRKYHADKSGVQKCANKAVASRQASAGKGATNVPTVAPATTPKKKGAPVTTTKPNAAAAKALAAHKMAMPKEDPRLVRLHKWYFGPLLSTAEWNHIHKVTGMPKGESDWSFIRDADDAVIDGLVTYMETGPKKTPVRKPKPAPVASTTTEEDEGEIVKALPPVKASAALKKLLDTIQKPDGDAEPVMWAIVAGITMGRYDKWLDELDETLSKRLEGMGYSFIDTNAPLRKAHKEATGKAPAAPKSKAKPNTLTHPITLANGRMTSDYTEDKRGTAVRRGTIVHTTATRGKFADLWAEVMSENKVSYSVRLLNGPDVGRGATLNKATVKPYYIVTAENAEMKKDVKKGPKVNVKEELAAARAALAETDDTDDTDDDNPAVRRVRKVKAPKAEAAPVKAAAPAAPGRRRIVRRG